MNAMKWQFNTFCADTNKRLESARSDHKAYRVFEGFEKNAFVHSHNENSFIAHPNFIALAVLSIHICDVDIYSSLAEELS